LYRDHAREEALMAKPYAPPEGVYALFVLKTIRFTNLGVSGQIDWDGKRYGNLQSAEDAQTDLDYGYRRYSFIWVFDQNETIPPSILFEDSKPIIKEVSYADDRPA
jgi:hypothetical protein